jgi:hypothetical protein
MYTAGDGDQVVVGLVVNGSAETIHVVEVAAVFRNAGGGTVAQESNVAPVVSIAPGQDSPFEIRLNQPPAGITSYEVFIAGTEEIPFLSAINITETVTSFSTSGVSGTLSNSSGLTYSGVTAWVAVFDAQGNVLRVAGDDAMPSEIPSGGNASFSVTFSDPAPSAASARAWTDGQGFTP